VKKFFELALAAAILTAVIAAAGFALSFSWQRSLVSAFGCPPLSPREAVYLLLTAMLLAIPLRK
jgi:hypothetical protein